VLWDKNVAKGKKKCIYNTTIKSIIAYVCEVWQIKQNNKNSYWLWKWSFGAAQ
jgi:hypothetical protein